MTTTPYLPTPYFPNSLPPTFQTPYPRHQEAELLWDGILTFDYAHDLPLVNHRDTIREAQDFVQVFRDEYDGGPLLALLLELGMHVFGSADVQAARGLGGY